MGNAFTNYVFGIPIESGDIGGLSDLRQIDLNLIYAIKEIMLPLNGYVQRFSETVSPLGQEIDPVTGLQVTQYQGTFTDWVYYNPSPTHPSLTGLLTTPTLSSSGSLAYIDYPNGAVFYSGVQSQQITMTYDYYSVYVQDGYPDLGEDPYKLEELRVPLISIDFERRKNKPFAIGGAFEEDRVFLINIVAASDSQRDDLMEMIDSSLRYDYPITLNYKNGFPINFNGDKNNNFDRTSANRWRHIRFKDNYSRVLRVPTEQDKLRHHSVTFLTIETT